MSQNGHAPVPIDKDAGLFVLTLKFNPVSKQLNMQSSDNTAILLIMKMLNTAQFMAIERMEQSQKQVERLVEPASGPLPPRPA